MNLNKIGNQSGVVLIFAYCTVALIIVLVAGIALRAFSELNSAQRNMAQTRGVYLAEGGVESVVYNLAYAVANHEAEPVTSIPTVLDGLYFPPSAGFLPSDFSLQYTCEAIDADHTITDDMGISTIVRNYQICALATNSNFLTSNNPLVIRLHELISRKKTYTFQHAVFYNDDLEMLPGPHMTLSGKIHSNSDIYIGSHNTLTVDTNYLYSAGSIYNQRKNDGSIMGGDVSIKLKDSPGYALMNDVGDPQPLDCHRSDWATESQIRWEGTVKSAVHGVTTLAVPEVGSIQPDGYYADAADVVINDMVLTKDGFVLTEGVDIPAGTLTISDDSFYNEREGKYVRMVEVDMHKLAGYDVGDTPGSPSYPSALPANGLLYATSSDAPAGKQEGVRLKKGAEIESSVGLTIVSNLPVYVQGDYNNVNKKPAAIICDAVNILSNAWNDGVGYSDAQDTFVNAAFIAGCDTTTAGKYNGGLENYPRLHEDWKNAPEKRLYIRGSFVELWNGQIAQGEWHYGPPYYKAPIRDWDYDQDFNNENNLPPFTPFAVEMMRVAWWKS